MLTSVLTLRGHIGGNLCREGKGRSGTGGNRGEDTIST